VAARGQDVIHIPVVGARLSPLDASREHREALPGGHQNADCLASGEPLAAVMIAENLRVHDGCEAASD
jgi:hypothetical protein